MRTPVAPSLCTVQFRVELSGVAVEGAVCKAHLLGINQASDGTVLSTEEMTDTTDADGMAELQLVQLKYIIKGSGIYDITVWIAGKLVAAKKVVIPNQTAVFFADLL